MSLDAPFSADDPRVLEAVEKQYLYGSTKDVLKNIENDIFEIINVVMRCRRLELEYPDNIPTIQLITIALIQLNKRYFSEGDVKLLEAFRRRCHKKIWNFMDVFEYHDSSGYGKAASSLLGALYVMNPPRLGNEGMSDSLGQPDSPLATVIGAVLESIDAMERAKPLSRKKNGKNPDGEK